MLLSRPCSDVHALVLHIHPAHSDLHQPGLHSNGVNRSSSAPPAASHADRSMPPSAGMGTALTRSCLVLGSAESPAALCAGAAGKARFGAFDYVRASINLVLSAIPDLHRRPVFSHRCPTRCCQWPPTSIFGGCGLSCRRRLDPQNSCLLNFQGAADRHHGYWFITALCATPFFASYARQSSSGAWREMGLQK